MDLLGGLRLAIRKFGQSDGSFSGLFLVGANLVSMDEDL